MSSFLEHYAPLTEVAKEVAPQKGVHLYHFAQSSCSQLVRTALAYKGIDYTSHHVNLALQDQLTPEYVKLNPRGVVPTLVIDGKVTTDSLNIVKFLDTKFPDKPTLLPADTKVREQVLNESEKVDAIPLFPVTFGNCHYPDKDKRPFFLRGGTRSQAGVKAKVAALIEEHRDDEELREFYEKRLEKAQESASAVTSEKVKKVVDAIVVEMDALEQALHSSDCFQKGGFLFTAKPSLADIMWSYVLNRFALLRLDQRLWGDGKHPNLKAYTQRLFNMKAFKEGVRAWESPLWLGYSLVKRKIFGSSFTVNP